MPRTAPKVENDDPDLAELTPDDVLPAGPSWQKRKSAEMRTVILEAAIDCLEEYGYAKTTVQMVTETANISRGAMLHHYATKRDLMIAVMDFTFYKRMRAYLDRMKALSDQERVVEHAGMEVFWDTLKTREFTAYLELATAARTDVELREVFLPKARRFDRMQREAAFRIFPEWADRHKEHMLAIDFMIATMQGILLNRQIWDSRSRRKLVRDFLSQMILMLREGKIDAPRRSRAGSRAASGSKG